MPQLQLYGFSSSVVFLVSAMDSRCSAVNCCSLLQVVASMDWPGVTKYRGLVRAQGHREEIIKDLYACVR